jgi:NADH-quinone oxidoreductase subunit J
MTLPFIIVALLTIAGALGAMNFRNLIHCALSLAIAFSGFAMLYLQLGAEFVGFAQVLVYVGAVAILVVFAILLTRGDGPEPSPPVAAGVGWGIGIAVAAFLAMAGAITSSVVTQRVAPIELAAPVRAIGDRLMTDYVLPLEVIGLLLTAALIGAVIIAMREKVRRPSGDNPVS